MRKNKNHMQEDSIIKLKIDKYKNVEHTSNSLYPNKSARKNVNIFKVQNIIKPKPIEIVNLKKIANQGKTNNNNYALQTVKNLQKGSLHINKDRFRYVPLDHPKRINNIDLQRIHNQILKTYQSYVLSSSQDCSESNFKIKPFLRIRTALKVLGNKLSNGKKSSYTRVPEYSHLALK